MYCDFLLSVVKLVTQTLLEVPDSLGHSSLLPVQRRYVGILSCTLELIRQELYQISRLHPAKLKWRVIA